MPAVEYIVLDGSGSPIRAGRCPEADFNSQAKEGETVRRPNKTLLGALQRRRLAIQDRVAEIRIQKMAEPSPATILAEALKAQGIVVSAADMEAAAERLRLARVSPSP